MPFVHSELVQTRSAAKSGATLEPTHSLDAIRRGDPAAAQLLYTTHADRIRAYLRRHTGLQDVESTVFSVLVEAVRSVREMDEPSMDNLAQTIRELAQQGVFALRRKIACAEKPSARTLDGHRDLINSVFTALDHREREILLRFSLLSENQNEISRKVGVPVLQIRQTLAKARVLFRISNDSGLEHAAAARA